MVRAEDLPVASHDEQEDAAPAPSHAPSAQDSPASASAPEIPSPPAPPAVPKPPAGDDVITLIERLGQLKDKGLLSDDEFAAKKTELLSRL